MIERATIQKFLQLKQLHIPKFDLTLHEEAVEII